MLVVRVISKVNERPPTSTPVEQTLFWGSSRKLVGLITSECDEAGKVKFQIYNPPGVVWAMGGNIHHLGLLKPIGGLLYFF